MKTKFERGQVGVLVAIGLLVIGLLLVGMMANARGMQQGANTIGNAVGNAIDNATASTYVAGNASTTIDDSDLQILNGTVVSFWVNKQRIYPNRHAVDSHGEYEANLVTNCYNDHGAFFIQANKAGDWYIHCLEEDGRTVRTTFWTRVGNKFHMETAYTKGDGAWSWSQIRAFFENKWGASKATFPSDGVLIIDGVEAPYLP